MSVKDEKKDCGSLKMPKTENVVRSGDEEADSKKICSFCAEGSYWCRLDSSEVICPHISCLEDGKCPMFKRKE